MDPHVIGHENVVKLGAARQAVATVLREKALHVEHNRLRKLVLDKGDPNHVGRRHEWLRILQDNEVHLIELDPDKPALPLPMRDDCGLALVDRDTVGSPRLERRGQQRAH